MTVWVHAVARPFRMTVLVRLLTFLDQNLKPVMAENVTASQGWCSWRGKLHKLGAASLHLLSMPTLGRDKLL